MINADKVLQWKTDVANSVDLYNTWFMNYAPKAYRETRLKTTDIVSQSLAKLNYLMEITPNKLFSCPDAISILRMCTVPPLARDRLTGLGKLNNSFLKVVEDTGNFPPKMKKELIMENLTNISKIFTMLIDDDIFPWVDIKQSPTERELYRASSIVADRVCGAVANPIIKNAQEQRQLALIEEYLTAKGYVKLTDRHTTIDTMTKGTFSFRFNIKANISTDNSDDQVNIPIDVVIKSKRLTQDAPPIFIECKSAGDFTNTNKRRKEEATKMRQLKNTYGTNCRLYLFLCGYFDTGYLGYEAAEGLDWIWEHRISDMEYLEI